MALSLMPKAFRTENLPEELALTIAEPSAPALILGDFVGLEPSIGVFAPRLIGLMLVLALSSFF